MDWIRENKTQATILGIFGAIALLLGVVLFMANSDYSTGLEELESINNKLATKEKSSLYPNEANVKALEEKAASYEESVGKLSGVLLALQADHPSEDITDTAFQAKLKKSIADLREKVGAGSKTLPKDFAYGFETYTISLPRSPEASKALNDYFDAVNAVVSTAIDAGVHSIDSIHRTELAVEKGPPPAVAPAKAQPKKAVASKSKAKGKNGKPAAAPVRPLTQVVERRTLTLKLTTDQGPYQALLNALASPSKMPYFTVVRSVRVENEKQEGPLKAISVVVANGANGGESASPTPPPAEAPSGAGSNAPKVEVIVPATPANKDAMLVMGGEKLHVHLEIDLVRFVEPAAETAGAGTQ